jgi:DNA-binding transcriptional LysR family regulator
VLAEPLTTELRRAATSSSAGPAVDLRELRYFVVVCEELHFGRAARRLHISQSPLSQTIAQLERKLGTRLLDRSNRHVELTAAGEVLAEHARRLLRQADDAVGATIRAGAGETGVLRVAAAPVAREAILPGLRHEFDERLPNLVVEVVEGEGDGMIDGLVQGASDLVLMLCPPVRDDVVIKPIRRDRPLAVVHRGHSLAGSASVSLDALAEHTHVLWPRQFARRSHDVVLAMFDGRSPVSARVVEASSGAFWQTMLGGGFSIVPSSAPIAGDFVGVPIDGTNWEFMLAMVWSRRTPPPVLPALIEAVDAASAANGWL